MTLPELSLLPHSRLAPGYDLKSGIDAKDAAVARAELAIHSTPTVQARLASVKDLRRALNSWKRGDAAKTAKYALAATQVDETNAHAYHLLAIALEKLGYVHKALVTYEKAYSLDPDDSDLLLNLGLTAWNLGHLEGAESMFRRFIAERPEHPAGYNNLGSVQRDRGSLSAAIETLRGAIYKMPTEPMLWNSLATALAEAGRAEESLVFYQEALRLNENYGRVWHNLGYSYMHLGRLEESLSSYEKALTLATLPTELREARHSRSICLIGMGRLAEGFKEYEIRNGFEFRTSVVHLTKAPMWNGEDLDGKKILMVGEQGLGDELMFANILPDMQKLVGATGKLQIAVDPRLIPLFARSFPEAEIGDYSDRKTESKHVRIFPWALEKEQPDFYAPFGTPLQFLRKTISDFPKAPYLQPDPAKVVEFRNRLSTLGNGPFVGICWRSMVLGVLRQKYYSAVDAWEPLLRTPNVTFVNLQYGDCAKELVEVQEKFGVTIHNFSDLNLKNDIDGAAALSKACDLVVSAPTAAAALAGAIGTPLWILVAGRVWPQLGTDEYPWYASTRVFSPSKFGDWSEAMPIVAEALGSFAAKARKAA